MTESSTPAQRLRVAIIGCGNVALNFHLPAYQALPGKYEIVGLADPTSGRLELGRNLAGLAKRQVHADPEELLNRTDVDVVDVCTPQHLHRDIVLAAAVAAKHVICEKPLAAAPADAAAMVSAARQAGVVLAVMHNYLFFPEVVALTKLIDSGELGDVRTVTVNMLGVVDSPGAAGARWRHDPASSGGGVLIDMLHGVYLAEHLLGAPVDAASAAIDTAGDGALVEGLASCRFEAGRRIGLVNIGWGHGQGGIAVHGSRGRAVVRHHGDGTMPWAPFESLTVSDSGGTIGDSTRTIDIPPGEGLMPLVANSMRDAVADLAEAITTHRPPAATGETALRILEATVAAYASAALRRTVDLPLPIDGPLYRQGVVGLVESDIPATSPVRQLGLFGLAPASSLERQMGIDLAEQVESLLFASAVDRKPGPTSQIKPRLPDIRRKPSPRQVERL